MIRGPILVFVLLVAVAGILTWLFLENFEKREEAVYVGYQGEARSNDLLAAERFLQTMGLDVGRLGSTGRLGEIDPAGSVLILGRRGASDTPEGVARLLGWVEAGGHLVVAARRRAPEAQKDGDGPVAIPDGLLDALDIQAVTGFLSAEQIAEASIPALELPDGEGFVEVDFDPDRRLETQDTDGALVLAGEYGAHLIRRTRGEGKVTVLSDMAFATNGGIGSSDHAEFFWRLLRADGEPPRRVWFVVSRGMAAFWLRLWERSWMLVASLALLLAAWIASAAPRFGPLVPAPTPGRRRLMEHVEASGRYYWRSGDGNRLLAAVEHALLREANRRREVVCARLHAALGSRRGEVSPFLPEAGSERSAFTRTVRAMETIRRHL